ncbi:kinase-like protein [Rhizopogon salebrosus TDB-379]|nr:kinase-like protein [Rhizopogon salebrosus TDB-379]
MGCCSSSIPNPARTEINGNGLGNATTQVLDARLHAIPPSSIEKLSRFYTSSGGLGDVWKCSWTRGRTNRLEVAVKVIRIANSLDERAIQHATNRLRREVAVWVKLRHPHILTLHGTVSEFGLLPSLVSTWMHNGALHGYLKRMELTMEHKLQLLKQVVNGLGYLHENDVIHGDLTNTNVVIDRNGIAVLADFGLSVALVEADRSYYNSYSVGAIRWLAPELASVDNENVGNADLPRSIPKPTRQSDIFSLGCIMLEVFSGRLPFWWYETTFQVFHSRYQRLEPYRHQSDVSVDRQHLVFMRRCWSLKPKERPTIGHAASFVEHELARGTF